MNKTLFCLSALVVLSLAACQNHADVAKNTKNVQQPDTCGAASFNYLIGKPVSTLDGMRFSKPMRQIAPNTAVTMDYRADRLNIESNEKGVITRLYCA